MANTANRIFTFHCHINPVCPEIPFDVLRATKHLVPASFAESFPMLELPAMPAQLDLQVFQVAQGKSM
jgi:hypothetical protein